ncbi:MAG: tetratricopeptide repeat-containing sensor histidine kinase [Ignavibacteria bacterium]|nr:tetratricopeptide repeat-containing sensor histidine kinase [Ignavibacteria bacterium]
MKKFLLLVGLIFSILLNLNAQTNTDSLNSILKPLTGIERINTLNKFALQLGVQNLPTKFDFANEAKKLSQKLNYSDGLIAALNNLGDAELKSKNYKKANYFFHSAINLLKSKKNDSLLAMVYSNTALNYEKLPNIDSAIIFHKNALEVNFKLKNRYGEAFAYNNLGLIYWKRGENLDAIENFKKAVAIREKLDNIQSLGNAVQNLGVAYWKYGDYENSFKCYQRALKLREQIGNRASYALVLNNIGLIYKRLKYDKLAESTFTEALRIADSLNHLNGIGYSHSNFGELYLDKGEPKKALEHFLIAYKIRSDDRDLNGVSLLLNSIGRSYEAMKELDKAKQYYQNGIDTSKSIMDKYALAMSLTNLARVLIIQNEINKAEELVNESIEISRRQNLLEILRDNYQLSSKIHIKNNRFENAFKELENYTILKDSLFNSLLIHNISNFSVRLTIESTFQENELLKQKNALQQADIERQKSFRNVLILITILTLMIFGILAVFYFSQRRSTRLIQKQKSEVEKLNELLQNSNNELEAINQTKDKLFAIIAHDLKSPFMSLIGFSEILNEEIESDNLQEAKVYAGYIHTSSSQLVILIQNLLDWARIQKRMIAALKEKYELKPLIEEIIKPYRISAKSKGINIEIECENGLFVFVDKGMIESAIRNLVSNAIKFTNGDGTVLIKAAQINNKIELTVTDSGIGIEDEDLDKLFNSEESFTTRGTDNEQGTGLGLIIVKEFVEKNDGTLSIQSEKGKGTEFKITLPVFEEITTA